jgi:hypothetical protein
MASSHGYLNYACLNASNGLKTNKILKKVKVCTVAKCGRHGECPQK